MIACDFVLLCGYIVKMITIAQLVRFKNTIAVSVWEILRKLDGLATKVKVMRVVSVVCVCLCLCGDVYSNIRVRALCVDDDVMRVVHTNAYVCAYTQAGPMPKDKLEEIAAALKTTQETLESVQNELQVRTMGCEMCV
jgi:hypothetical protein